jgi:hypothetical protein
MKSTPLIDSDIADIKKIIKVIEDELEKDGDIVALVSDLSYVVTDLRFRAYADKREVNQFG